RCTARYAMRRLALTRCVATRFSGIQSSPQPLTGGVNTPPVSSYLPHVFVGMPPHTIREPPVQTAVASSREGSGPFLKAVHFLVPKKRKAPPLLPPHTNRRAPSETTSLPARPTGRSGKCRQPFVLPVYASATREPPATKISVPFHTAVAFPLCAGGAAS